MVGILCIFFPVFQRRNRSTDFDEIWYGLCTGHFLEFNISLYRFYIPLYFDETLVELYQFPEKRLVVQRIGTSIYHKI
jgi:hypothetical protein